MAKAQAKPAPAQANKYDDELAEFAKQFADQESAAAGGSFFGLGGGTLTFNGNPVPDNEMAVIVVDGIMENVFYPGAYDPATPQSPICFAFGRNELEMKPHVKSLHPQHPQCKGCPHNEFGSADVGEGKACRNTRRLAMIAAGNMEKGRFEPFDDTDHFETAQLAYMKLPVTSVKGYATFVKQLADSLKLPPFAVFTKVKVVKDPSKPRIPFKVIFESLAKAPKALLEILKARHEEAKTGIDFPYVASEEVEEVKPKAKAKRKY